MNDRSEYLDLAAEQLAAIRAEVALLRLRLALKKFNPSQPRWPSGRPDGGQWRPSSAEGALKIAGTYDAARAPICLAQQRLDHELCRMAKSYRCWQSADLRYNNCMRDTYIPPLEVGR
jgi:hypothetical protein